MVRDKLPDDFDPEEYLWLHGDVAEAGVDAAQHYLAHGRREGRRYKEPSPDELRLDRPLFFCHIPKTAGTALRVALEAAFPAHAVVPDRLMMGRAGGQYPPIDVVAETLRYQRNAVRLLRGHYHYCCGALLSNPITIVLLRDPVARCVSSIKHNIRKHGITEAHAISELSEGRLPVADNHMTRYLGGSFPLDVAPLAAVHHSLLHGAIDDPRGRLASAIENACAADIVGLDGPAAVAPHLRRLGFQIDDSRRVNVSDVELSLSQKHLDTIAELNALDIELYEQVQRARG